jgi:hypothetical protein
MANRCHPRSSSSSPPAWSIGMKQLGPGCYVDAENVLHISELEICDHLGIAYTAANSAVIELAASETVRKHYGVKIPIEIVQGPNE